MATATPILDYTTRPPPAALAWQSLVAAIGVSIIPSFMCICGHLGQDALVATVPTAAVAWWGFARRLSRIGRLLAAGVVIIASMALAKNLLDVLWFGHDPLLR